MNKREIAITFALSSIALSTQAYADFLSESKATLGMKNFYFNNDNRDGTAAPSKTEEWAQGFMLDYKSGYTDGTIGFGVDALGLLGVTLDSGQGRHVGSTMIPSDSDNSAVDEWSRLGLTGKVKMSKTELRYGTLIPKLPILVANDGRLLPQAFEGGQITSSEFKDLTLTGGRIEHATGRGSSDQTGLAVTGGTRESNQFDFAGGDWKVTKDLTAQYYYANLENYYTQQFFGLIHTINFLDNQSLKTDLRYFKTDSSGENSSGTKGYRVSGYTKNGDGEIDNRTWSAALIYTLGGHAITAGYQSVSDGSNFTQLNQGSLVDKGAGGASLYLYTDRLIQSFTRAGERTAFGQYAYDFAALGVPGLKASVIYLSGDNIKTTTGNNQKEWERDISLDYVLQSGTFKGVGFGWRNGKSNSEAARDQDQNRVLVSYSIPLL
ncbi:Anaerobically-induced outer membrane porin OprE precursor [Pseudomonas fluorescens HK44]|uniref:Anaerobically-induced outer membrane porin OprE n=1 Tax=Pseudomonas fluorescens HK44 TaxID=1042209 RepID=A0A010SSN7_PSEFL|nr:OprD family porin [Pseudomonas fluorescens]EXF93998.1 Anaerobically-induced outer membrane porin OprE precursor [Pseudomonas fluorescens HK44]